MRLQVRQLNFQSLMRRIIRWWQHTEGQRHSVSSQLELARIKVRFNWRRQPAQQLRNGIALECPGIRLQEILAYVKTHDLNDVPCLIVDDDYMGFRGKKGLFFPTVVPDAASGFSFKDAEETARWITEYADELKPKEWFWPLQKNETPKDETEPDRVAA